MLEFIELVLYVGICFLVGLYAKKLNRNAIAWFLWTLLVITPIISFPCLILLGRHQDKWEYSGRNK